MNSSELSSPVERPARVASFPEEKRRPYIILCILLWSILAYLFISHFIMMSIEIKGTSMSPTLKDGQRFFLFRLPLLWRDPHAGEIVVIRDPQDHNLSIKRIVAGPRQKILISRDGVFVDGAKLYEPYLTAESAADSGLKKIKQITLGPTQYFVMGDNRDWSADSRIYGPVPRDFILGTIEKTD